MISRPGDFADVNNNRAWLVNAFLKPNRPFGLRIGGSVYRDALNPLNGPAAREWIQSGHIVWTKETPEFIAEFANVSHVTTTGTTPNSQGLYAQVAYRCPGCGGRSSPTTASITSTYRAPTPSSARWCRSSIPPPPACVTTSPTRGLKVEYRDYRRRDLPAFHGIFTQTSFTF